MSDEDQAARQEGVTALRGAFDDLNSLLDQLRDELAETVEQWDGQATNTYRDSRESCRASLERQRRIIEELEAG